MATSKIPQSGIYAIINTVNGKFYIGKATSFRNRRNNHNSLLRRGIHDNKHLQTSWNKYGESAFIFAIVELCSIDNLEECEQWYLNKYRGTPECYNISPLSKGGGGECSQEKREKISNAKKGKQASEIHRLHLSESHKGIKLSEGAREKLRVFLRGEGSSSAKLTWVEVREIRVRYAGGDISQRKLATEYGVAQCTVKDIVLNRTWRE